MATFRRIMKYAPAALMGLIVLVWAGTFCEAFEISISGPLQNRWQLSYAIDECSVFFKLAPPGAWVVRHYAEQSRWWLLGYFEFSWGRNPEGAFVVQLPFAILATGLAPLVIGALFSFRFRLWHYFAYTALVAIELAYYLRWQE